AASGAADPTGAAEGARARMTIDWEAHRFVFVGGLHRSGTTLLARCLAEHPEVSGFSGTGAREDEGQHLQTVYPPGRAYGGAGRVGVAPRGASARNRRFAVRTQPRMC